MKPSILCMFGVAFLGFAFAGKDLWSSAPAFGWFLAVFFFSSALFVALKNQK
ncbi:hypothetical protein SAMN03159341_11937 [Paenibacillus sp. 1_12]|uniref:hypothetical protein n=1 Tax=Paenibacillus sp. 1_12 TaxID=1566278 RepID=UPI0008F13145|nr:hypothetical protein [Paenibacillus sp. 1_12]SFM17449.1 hypothetical protein SAMN03159341_11937 [Paenibacillus sp. 1_12]